MDANSSNRAEGRSARIHAQTSLRFFAAFAIVVNHGPDFGLIPPATLQRVGLAQWVMIFSSLRICAHLQLRRRPVGGAAFSLGSAGPYLACGGSFDSADAIALSTGLVFTYWRPWMARLRGFAALFAASASHGCPPVRDFYFAYNSVTWSVSLEAMFYLRLPLLLLALRRHWQLILGLVAV